MGSSENMHREFAGPFETSPNTRWSKNQDFPTKFNPTIKIEQENDNKIQINRDTCYYIQNLNYHLNPTTKQDTYTQITL